MNRESVGVVYSKARRQAGAMVRWTRRVNGARRSDGARGAGRDGGRVGSVHPRDAGMSTAEYAVGTIAACAFAAVLYKVATSAAVSGELQQLIERALSAKF